MAIRIQIFGFKTIPYTNKKSGSPEKMIVYQALLIGDGTQTPAICELMLPKDHPELVPGFYHGELSATVGYSDKRLSGTFTKLIAVAPAAAARVA